MFVIQQLLEQDGKYTSLEQNRVITPHPSFALLRFLQYAWFG